MGTRNLTMVIKDAETKVAQYGQWDGYPSGQGATALEFLRGCDFEKFKEKLNKIRWITDEEIGTVENDKNWTENYPYLSRNCGAEILELIYDTDDVKFLQNSEDFAADSLFNEWTYVIDLDKNTFEVYTGFNKTPLTENDRFFKLSYEPEHRTEKYYPVKLLKSYSLLELPTVESFIDELEKLEKEEETD